MTRKPSKRQKRNERDLGLAETRPQDLSPKEGVPEPGQSHTPEDEKKVNEGEGPRQPRGSGGTGKTTTGLAAPKKRFFRQRAHANVFSDHNLD